MAEHNEQVMFLIKIWFFYWEKIDIDNLATDLVLW